MLKQDLSVFLLIISLTIDLITKQTSNVNNIIKRLIQIINREYYIFKIIQTLYLILFNNMNDCYVRQTNY